MTLDLLEELHWEVHQRRIRSKGECCQVSCFTLLPPFTFTLCSVIHSPLHDFLQQFLYLKHAVVY